MNNIPSRTCLTIAVGAVLTLAASWAQAQPQPATDDVERGRQLFMANGCYSCHGTVGQGGERSAAPRLAPEPYPFEAFKVLVRTPRESMPRFDVRYLSDAQLLQIHRYLSAVPKGLAAKDITVLQSLAP